MTPGLAALATFSPMLANAGTPLMWASMFHLVVGNALLGLAEGLVLASVFKTPKRQTAFVLVLANYASAWIGGLFILPSIHAPFDVTIENLRLFFWGMVAASFFVSLVIEFPFVWGALRGSAHRSRNALRGILLIHTLSYPVLFGWYALVSGTSMMTRLNVVSAKDLVRTDSYALYYLTPAGDKMIRSDLAGLTQDIVRTTSASNYKDRLFARRGNANAFDLWIILHSDTGRSNTERIEKDFSTLAPIDWSIAEGHSDDPRGTWFNFGPVASIAPPGKSRYHTGFWPDQGISYRNDNQSRRTYALATPFLRWNARNATEISGGRVIFQLGRDQICLLHAESDQIALLARGKGALVAAKTTPPPPPTE